MYAYIADTAPTTATVLLPLLHAHDPPQYQMGGKEAAAIIRQHNTHIPIIFLTGEIAASMKE
jgi:CheY-like chemotaxis protein